MRRQKLVSHVRESDGRFALRLESEAACQRADRDAQVRREREAQLIAENAEWCQAMGFDPSVAAEIFA